MGRRVAIVATETQHVTSSTRCIRKRGINANGSKVTPSKTLRLNGSNYWHENDDEHSSSPSSPVARNHSTKQANNSSILLNSSNASLNGACGGGDISINESPKPVYTLRPSVVNGTILKDILKKPWRLGRPIGKGNFGEIFLASDNIAVPVTNENAKFVVKIEPHSNGPLFVEIHCLINTAKKNSTNINQKGQFQGVSQTPPSGIPNYIASGSHYFGSAQYRFLVLQRFDRDLHSLIKNCRVHQKSVLTLAINIVNVLEKLHDKGYCHNDVKAQNLMISKCKFLKPKTTTAGTNLNGKLNMKTKYEDDDHYDEKQPTTDSGNSSEQEANDYYDDEDFVIKGNGYKKCNYAEDEDEDFDDGATSNSNNSNSLDLYQTPVNKNRKRRSNNIVVEFSGSNPVRSCRREKRNTIYDDMVKSHYLRPTKRISYSEFFTEDGLSIKEDSCDTRTMSSDDECDEFLPQPARRSSSNKKPKACFSKRLTRRQEKLLSVSSTNNEIQKISYRKTNVTPIEPEMVIVVEERIFLIDFGLASKYMERGVHRPFVMDQRRAHDGTLEFTSRDAHMGAHSRRSDLECLGYNLIFWSQGYLPWKDAAIQLQQEKVHQAKEYLMTDVREMLKQIYGKSVPKYLGEFLYHVGQLAYHERPDYSYYRQIFKHEYQQLGYLYSEMELNNNEIARTCVRIKEEIENKHDIFDINKTYNNPWSIMNNLSVCTPFQERTLSNRVSPKNLRSKSDKKTSKKKKFSWAEILSQDPDQIARERAEKEFDREEELSEIHQLPVRRYEGKPTYAILEIENRLKMRSLGQEEEEEFNEIDNAEFEEEETEEEENEEEDEEKSSDDNEEFEEEEESNEVDTDISDTEEFNKIGRKRRTQSKNSITTTKRVNSKTPRTSTSRYRNNKKPRTSLTQNNSIKTRKSATTKLTSPSGSKRGRKVNHNSQGANALESAGDIEQNNTPKYLQSILTQGAYSGGRKPPKRRARRRLIKTDAGMDYACEKDNSNFNPDMHRIFNVFHNIKNDDYCCRGYTQASRHIKK